MSFTTSRYLQLLLMLVVLCPGIHGSSGAVPPTLSAEELRYIASLNLCTNFHGLCGVDCDRYIMHRWRIPLCDQDRKCCISQTAYQGARVLTETTTVVTTTTTSTESTPSQLEPEVAPNNALQAVEASTHWLDDLPSDENRLGNAPGQQSQDTEFLGPDLDQCGQMEWSRRRKRIVGGRVSAPGAWPWLIALRSMLGAQSCSGALVTQRWVVTAAHCFKQFALPTMWRARVGEHNLLTTEGTERDLVIVNIFIYPGYRTRSAEGRNSTLYARYKHDLALIQLAEDAGVEPVCLPTGDAAEPEIQNSSGDSNLASRFRQTALESRGECWVSGWGFTRDNSSTDQVLREVQGDLVNSDDCGDLWGTRLDRDMICFGDGTRGPCSGDSGGPLSCSFQGRWYLGGVVSWGTEDCNLNGYPSVFTRIAPYLPWIQSNIRQQHQREHQQLRRRSM